jgi:hypothetical protein
MKCKPAVNVHRTRDEASPAVAKIRQVAAFPAGHSAVCNCSASGGKMKPENCDGLCVYDGDNVEVARFSGKQFRAQQAEDGGIVVFSMPGATQDQAFNLGNALRALNEKNEEFWRSRYEEE